MDIGIKIIYLMSGGEEVIVEKIYHELTRTSLIFYYFEKHGIKSKDLKAIFKL